MFVLFAVLIPASISLAYSTTGTPSVSGLGCSGNNVTSNWGSATAPANAVSVAFTITGGGGSGGDNNAGTGGAGGHGAIVTGSVPISAGQVLWAKLGCGGLDGSGSAAGYTTGPAIDNLGGGGGGSSALCIGSATANCGGGTIIAIAGGGGGGGRGSGTGTCSDKNGGGGGDASAASGSGSTSGGTAYVGTNGGDGAGSNPVVRGGRAGAVNAGGASGGGNNPGSVGGNPSGPSAPSGTGNGGGANGGANSIRGGGGGGGWSGGAGGDGGEDGNCTFGNWSAGGGGGGGSSWVRSSVSSIGVSASGFTGSCAVNSTNSNSGGAASAGNQSWGCGGGLSITWTIGNPPTGAGQTTGTATKGVGLAIALANADLDNNNRTCSIVSAPSKGGVVLSGGAPGTNCTATYTANANTSGNDSFTYLVTDTDGFQSATYTVTIPIGNRAPTGAAVAAPGTNYNKGAGTTVNLANTDPDNDSPLTCAITVAPTKATLSSGTSCSRTLTPNANTVGADSFTYTVSDAYGGTSASYVVNFTILNRTPSSAPQSLSVAAGSALPITLGATDLDNDTLTCNAPVAAPTKGALTGTGCSRSYTSNAGSPNAGIGGADSFTYTVSDQNGATSSASTISITISNPDLSLTKSHSGRFNPGTGTGTYTIGIANTAAAVANGTTTITDTLPSGMVYRSSNVGSSGFTCTGTAGVSTTVSCTRATQIPVSFSSSLTITVDVAEGASSPLVNSATITSVYELASTAANNTATDSTLINARPVATGATVATDVDTPKNITLTATDPNGDALTYTIVASPAHGALSGSGANRQYTPDSGYQGADSFTWKATDTGGLDSSTVTVTIYVGVARFTGTVTNDVGGAPLAGIEARLIDNTNPANPDPATIATVTTNGSGVYDFGLVNYGNYVLRFVDPLNNFIPEYHLNSANRTGATNIALSSAATATTVNAGLTPAARIQGVIRSSAGANPTIDGIQVRLFKVSVAGSKAVTSGPGGAYKFELLTAGTYQLWFRDVSSGQWKSEWYDEQTAQASATNIVVSTGQQVTINEQLDPVVPVPPPTVGTVTGTVQSSAGGNAPIAGIQVRLYKEPYETSQSTTTDGNGQYTFSNVLAGNYKIWFRVVTGNAYASEYYNDKPDLASADVVVVGAGATIADAQLTPPPPAPDPNTAAVSGTVTQIDGITPIAGIQVRLYVNGQSSGSVAATTDANGDYSFVNKAPGDYQIWFRDLGSTYFSEWNLDKASQATADVVTLSNNTTVTVNASLTAR